MTVQATQTHEIHPNIPKTTRKQRTLKTTARFSGIGIHTGSTVEMRFVPAEPGTGILFRRVDLPGQPAIPAAIEYVRDTSRSTTIGIGDVQIHTIEHVLAAIRAYRIDNLYIELSSHEPPVGHGSSDVFVEMIEEAGIMEQDAEVPIVKLKDPVFWSEGDIHIVAIPSDTYQISYTLSYPNCPALRCQYQSFTITPETFKLELAPCRTFALYEEVSFLMDRGLIKGGSLDNAVIIKGEAILSKGGLFYPDEMVRHKILDMVGDLSLIGFDFIAHVIAIRAGHASNCAFAQKMLTYITTEIP
ncbi:MAG: UDP-3-O-acyl-N-acetylglucosamine deacetylase [Chlamydiales bacterium]|nr:UDP-3-O-acyl-N-acetylglucosamine deacetylase [Chlamydiia bacterium]MCP5506911.1 UDP-3-O-acyl-N-acetylglucosamine deacetylase [Chlamydiales bacterium]